MVRIQESIEPTVSEMENILQEYRERISHALETDSNKLKEKAEKEASQIIAKAKEQAEQILRISREEAAEAQKESARAISETREEATLIITEIIKNGTTQAQSEFTQIASDTISKTSLLLTQVSKKFEQIISETEKNIKGELEHLSALAAEAEIKLQALEKIYDNKPEIDFQPEVVEAVTPVVSISEKMDTVNPSSEVQRDTPVKESVDPGLFTGSHTLEIVAPFNQEQQGGVPEWLTRVPDLKITQTGGYARANRYVKTYNIDLEQPMPLLKILKTIPSVKGVSEYKGNIEIKL